MEIWKTIIEFPDYEVSSWGNVRKKNSDHNLNPEYHRRRYLRVDLKKDGKRYHKKVHRLVAEGFIPNPDNKPQVNHKDGNKQNNSVTNLEWVTDKENKIHQQRMYRLKAETV